MAEEIIQEVATQEVEPKEAVPEVAETKKARKVPSRASVLVFGILSLVFSCDFSILGIIFGFVARSRSTKIMLAGQPATGPAKVGRVFGTIGAVLSIVMTILGALFLVALAFGIFVIATDPEASKAFTEFFTELANNLGITIA